MTDGPEPMTEADLGWAHALNQANAEALASETQSGFKSLFALARFARVVRPEAAFLLAFDAKPAEDSPNFDWFAARHPGALYIDRVAVDDACRGAGHGRTLYEHLFAEAASAGFRAIGAEVNSDPPNPASHAFHRRMGFRAVGEARLPSRGKTVTYYLRDLDGH